MTKLGTRMLSFLLKTEKAGACVPSHGDRCCGYVGGTCQNGRYYKIYRYGNINCYGSCSSKDGSICNKIGSGEYC